MFLFKYKSSNAALILGRYKWLKYRLSWKLKLKILHNAKYVTSKWQLTLFTLQVILAGKSIGFIIHKGRIFLEKCGAFSSLGRMYVIRCSDYRRSDKTLASVGLKPKKHYLYESQTNPGLTQLFHIWGLKLLMNWLKLLYIIDQTLRKKFQFLLVTMSLRVCYVVQRP